MNLNPSKFNTEEICEGFFDQFNFQLTDKNKGDLLLDSEDMVFVEGLHRGCCVKIKMHVVVLADLCVSEFGHSLFVGFEHPAEGEIVQLINKKAQEVVPEDYEYKSMFKDGGAFFVKLKTKNDNYRALKGVSPDNVDQFPIKTGTKIELILRFKVWMKPSEKKAGTFADIITVTDLTPKPKKRLNKNR